MPDHTAHLSLPAHHPLSSIQRAERIERWDQVMGWALHRDRVDHLVDLVVANVGPLRADELRGARRKEQQISIAEQTFGPGVVQNDLRIDPARHFEGDAGGDVGFDDAGDHLSGGALGGENQMDPDGAGHLRDAGDGGLDVGARHHHQVGKFIDDRDDEGHLLRDGSVERGFEVFIDFSVIKGADVAQAELFEDFVANLHLFHEPLEGGVSAVGFRDDGRDHMGEARILGQLHFFRIDHQEFHLIGPRIHENRHDDGVDADRFARSGGSGDEAVGHFRKICEDPFAIDRFAEQDQGW